MQDVKTFVHNHSHKLTLFSSALLALFSLGVLVSVNRPVTGINEGIISDRVLGESEASYPYLLDFFSETLDLYNGSSVMIAGTLINEGGEYAVLGENNTLVTLKGYVSSGAVALGEGEETKAIVVGELVSDELEVDQVFFVPAVISNQRLLSIVAKELESYRDCLNCQNDDILKCIGSFKIDSKAVITSSGSAINLDYAVITSEDEYYRISLNVLTNQNLVFQDASNLEEKCS